MISSRNLHNSFGAALGISFLLEKPQEYTASCYEKMEGVTATKAKTSCYHLKVRDQDSEFEVWTFRMVVDNCIVTLILLNLAEMLFHIEIKVQQHVHNI